MFMVGTCESLWLCASREGLPCQTMFMVGTCESLWLCASREGLPCQTMFMVYAKLLWKLLVKNVNALIVNLCILQL